MQNIFAMSLSPEDTTDPQYLEMTKGAGLVACEPEEQCFEASPNFDSILNKNSKMVTAY